MRGWRAVLTTLSLAAVTGACGFNPAGQGGDDGSDPDGGDDGSPGDAPCIERCENGSHITCSGGQETSTACSAGCLDAGGPHCATLVPSNGAGPEDLVDVTGDLVAPAGRLVVVDTDDGSIVSYVGGTPTTIRDPGNGLGDMIRFRVRSQANGAPAVAIFGVRSLSVADTGRLRAVGDRPVLFLVATTATISGIVDVGAGRSAPTGAVECQECSGPGGGDGATDLVAAGGCAPGLNGNYSLTADETGGGGGGFGADGARGGDASQAGGGVTPITGCTATTLVPLEGGSGGGRGATNAGLGAEVGGGGGGAIQITAHMGVIINGTGELYAGGAGGAGSLDDYGGGGGGAGGGILLEAPAIMIAMSSRLTANGGGGGSGREANRGENGTRGTARASGGTGNGNGGNDGRGGLGGVGAAVAQAATQGYGMIDGTGGGGGGAGIIRLNSVTPVVVPSGVVISPAHTLGEPTRQ